MHQITYYGSIIITDIVRDICNLKVLQIYIVSTNLSNFIKKTIVQIYWFLIFREISNQYFERYKNTIKLVLEKITNFSVLICKKLNDTDHKK
jgi:hypothetical protein